MILKDFDQRVQIDLENLILKLRSKKLSLGFGESCTGGLLSATLAKVPGVSDLFMGSIVSYSYQAKVDLLRVSWDTLKKEGAVSEAVALEMVRGVRESLKVQVAASITGIAGPSGGTPDKPVGTVWFAVSGPQGERAERKLFSGNRQEIQEQSAAHALKLLNELVN
ncbi:MAG: CinA family protein [Proteobacteria bacterium]|nr:CinA family protein [Pseudomonadota bacterium]